MKRLYIIGDPVLVEEYTRLAVEKGLTVTVGGTAAGKRKDGHGTFPRGVRIAARPTGTVDAALELTLADAAAKRQRLELLDKSLPARTPILTSALTVPVGEQSLWVTHRGRLVGLGALPTLLRGSLMEFSRSAATTDAACSAAKAFATVLGKEVAFVADRVGMVLPRILCMLANEAYFAMAEGVAAARDIDTAMMLGTNHPRGPVEWTRAIGPDNVLAVLSALHDHFGEDRYRACPLLRRAAAEALAG